MDGMIMAPRHRPTPICPYGCCDEAKRPGAAKHMRRSLKRSGRQIWQAEVRRETARIRAELDN